MVVVTQDAVPAVTPGVPLTESVSEAASDKSIFPVVTPPIVRVLPRRDWIELVELSKTIPVPEPPEEVVADRVATGEVAPLTLRTANFAEVVDWPPTNRSTVELFGYKAPAVWFQKVSRAREDIDA